MIAQYATLYLTIGMAICYGAWTSEAGRLNIDRYVHSHFKPERHRQGYTYVQLFLVAFWPLFILGLKGRF